MSAQEGFVSVQVLRTSEAPTEFLIVTKWMNEQAAKRWLESDQRKATDTEANQLGAHPLEDALIAGFVHQQFGAQGGAVITGSADGVPANMGGRQ
jgi:heme-degrading monooxygenase HmoA